MQKAHHDLEEALQLQLCCSIKDDTFLHHPALCEMPYLKLWVCTLFRVLIMDRNKTWKSVERVVS